LVVRLPNPSDGRGVLAEITEAGREVTEEATQALLGMDFGLGCYSGEELWGMHEALTRLRVDFGDFPAPVAGAADRG
ncbi:MarR family transcriptional regulator, partial [Streptomyces sp. NPDC000931]